MSKAANAVLALSRAFYGKRLNAKQYSDLLACKSMNEIASYLRTRTVYSEAFNSVQVSEYSSKVIEDLIFRHTLKRYDSLCRFELAIGNEFYKYFIVRTEIEQILKCTLLIIGGNTNSYMMQLSEFLSKHLSIDLYALGKANTLEDIAKALEKTPYEKVFERCLKDPERNYLTFELAFESYFNNFQFELVNRCFKGGEKDAMHEMLCRDFDRSFIEKQLRTVKYYSGNLAVTNLIQPVGAKLTLLSEKQVRAIVASRTVPELAEALERTVYSDCISAENTDEAERRLYQTFYTYCKKKIRFSSYPGVVMYSYMFLAEAEAMNIVRIVEGIKYQIPTEEIKNSLFGVGD